MVDTVRTDTAVLALLADNTSGAISPQDTRDAYATLRAGTTWINTAWSAADILAAMQAGGHLHFAAGSYSLSGLAADQVLSNALRITGAGRDLVTITVAGASESLATECFLLRANLFCSGVTFSSGGVVFSIEGLDAAIAEIVIEDCGFANVGAAIVHNSIASLNVSASLGRVLFNRNLVRECNSGVALRLGDGGQTVAQDIPITFFQANYNDLETLDKYGIVCNYDSALPSGSYVDSYAEAIGNRIVDLQGRSGSSVTGFGINLSSCREVLISGNYLRDIALGDRVDLEPIYSKSPRSTICNNIIIDGGENQTAIAAKGDDAAAVPSAAVSEAVHIFGNTIIGVTDGAILNGIWVQGSNVYVHDNIIKGLIGNSAIRTQSTTPATNLRIENNEIDHASPAGAHGIRVDTSVNNLQIRGNRIRATAGTTGTFRSILAQVASGETIDNAVIADNVIIKDGYSGTQIGIEIDKDAGATVTAPQILRNHGDGLDTFISLVDQALDGSVRVMGNTEVGVTTDVSNASTSTVEEAFNSWDIAA